MSWGCPRCRSWLIINEGINCIQRWLPAGQPYGCAFTFHLGAKLPLAAQCVPHLVGGTLQGTGLEMRVGTAGIPSPEGKEKRGRWGEKKKQEINRAKRSKAQRPRSSRGRRMAAPAINKTSISSCLQGSALTRYLSAQSGAAGWQRAVWGWGLLLGGGGGWNRRGVLWAAPTCSHPRSSFLLCQTVIYGPFPASPPPPRPLQKIIIQEQRRKSDPPPTPPALPAPPWEPCLF